MGKKGKWFSVLKKALSPSKKSKSKKWAEKEKLPDQVVSSSEETVVLSVCAPPPPPLPPPPLPPSRDDAKLAEAEDEQSMHASSMAAEAVVAAAQAADEVVHLTNVAPYSGKSKEEIAAIKIQTIFRGYLARRALHALRGLVRLRSLIQGQSVKRQTATTLQAMQTLARMQSQIRARRIRMSEENQALQRQLQQKREKEFEKLGASIGERWDDSAQSKEQIEANLLHKQEAALRREKALAYAFSHQRAWKNATKPATETFMDPNNPQWDWSWLERWMAARPWENRSTVDNNDRASVKSAASHAASLGETTRAYSRRNLNDNKPSPGGQKSSRPPNRQSPSTPLSKALSTSSVTGKVKLRSTKGSTWGGDDDSRSLLSVQSAHYRRHSIAGSSSMRNDESLGSLSSVPSYMAPTNSAKGRSNSSSPLGLDQNGTPTKASVASAKKRLSYSASPAGSRRHSGPPKFDARVFKDIEVHVEEKVSNGENGR